MLQRIGAGMRSGLFFGVILSCIAVVARSIGGGDSRHSYAAVLITYLGGGTIAGMVIGAVFPLVGTVPGAVLAGTIGFCP
jgi:hypothetical protein